MFAVIETGGRQFRVRKDSVITIEKLDAQVGDHLEIDKVLLISNGETITAGTPYLEGSSVKVTVLDQFRGKKIRVFKMKQRKRYRKSQGHRQYYTKVRVEDIIVS